jgi:hypothetical protein
MARPATGQVIERAGKHGTAFALRFTLPTGERRQARLGREADGWTRRRAEEELQAVLADLRRGRQNDIASPPPDKPDPLFAEFAHEWFERVRPELRPNTVLDYEWQLVRHLLPHFGRLPLSARLAEGRSSPNPSLRVVDEVKGQLVELPQPSTQVSMADRVSGDRPGIARDGVDGHVVLSDQQRERVTYARVVVEDRPTVVVDGVTYLAKLVALSLAG